MTVFLLVDSSNYCNYLPIVKADRLRPKWLFYTCS